MVQLQRMYNQEFGKKTDPHKIQLDIDQIINAINNGLDEENLNPLLVAQLAKVETVEELRAMIQDIVLGEIPNDSLPLVKLTQEAINSLIKVSETEKLTRNGIIASIGSELKPEHVPGQRSVKVNNGSVILNGRVFDIDTVTLQLERSDISQRNNELQNTNASGVLNVTYFPLSNEDGTGLATTADILVRRADNQQPVTVNSINATTGQIITNLSSITAVEVTYKTFMKRIDSVIVGENGQLQVLKGISTLPIFEPQIPIVSGNVFRVANLNIRTNYTELLETDITRNVQYYGSRGLGSISDKAWMYVNFKEQLTAQEIADIEANPSLMEIINNSASVTSKLLLDNHIGATGDAHGVATQSNNGFLSTVDKAKLDTNHRRMTATLSTATNVFSSTNTVNFGFSVNPVFRRVLVRLSSGGNYRIRTQFQRVTGTGVAICIIRGGWCRNSIFATHNLISTQSIFDTIAGLSVNLLHESANTSVNGTWIQMDFLTGELPDFSVIEFEFSSSGGSSTVVEYRNIFISAVDATTVSTDVVSRLP